MDVELSLPDHKSPAKKIEEDIRLANELVREGGPLWEEVRDRLPVMEEALRKKRQGIEREVQVIWMKYWGTWGKF